jgi:hypothetical protein
MQEYVIITDSSCDLPAEMADAMKIRILPLLVSIEGREYRNYSRRAGAEFPPISMRTSGGAPRRHLAANAVMFLTMLTPFWRAGRTCSNCFFLGTERHYQTRL